MSITSPTTEPTPLREDETGDIRVGESRVLFDIVVHAFDRGATPETIVQNYPTLELSDVYASIAYYLRHPEEVQAYLNSRQQRVEAIRQRIESQQEDASAIRSRLLALREGKV